MTHQPPPRHGTFAHELAARNAGVGLTLPVCAACGHTVYPLRENCPACLSDRLEWKAIDDHAELLAVTVLHHSNEPFYKDRVPLRVGSVRLAGGAVAIVFVDEGVQPGDTVRVRCDANAAGSGELHAQAR